MMISNLNLANLPECVCEIQTSLPLWFFVPHLQMAQAKRWYSRLWLPVQYAHGQPDPLLCSGA